MRRFILFIIPLIFINFIIPPSIGQAKTKDLKASIIIDDFDGGIGGVKEFLPVYRQYFFF